LREKSDEPYAAPYLAPTQVTDAELNPKRPARRGRTLTSPGVEPKSLNQLKTPELAAQPFEPDFLPPIFRSQQLFQIYFSPVTLDPSTTCQFYPIKP
jgi:hypothetical protein